MFKVGDLAVYPTQGVGVIESIESKEFVGEKHDFYILRILDSDMTIMIPVNNTGSVGMRTLIDKDRVSSIYDVLKDKSEFDQVIASWSRRQRGYNDKIKSGDLFEVAEVLRDLYQIKENKELSYGEKKVLELARKLLVKEVALAAGTEEQQVVEQVESFFH
ncbi:MAG: CarD family transcriptional regulator [Desulfuromonadales bacterium C00003096]|jgi:CarD family transcriptional regulator|nr:MAG: CarD family transcriptional regulator [Desulfuromonadales bacterium C00003096]